MSTKLMECEARHKFMCEFTPHSAEQEMYYIYVLKYSKTNKLYYGYTNNLERRINEHNRQKDRELIYYEAYKAEFDAHCRERQLKRYAQAVTSLKRRLKESLK